MSFRFQYCKVCELETEHETDDYEDEGGLLPGEPEPVPQCCNDWGRCNDCGRTMHGPKDTDTANVTATDSWVCWKCLRENYDEFGERLETAAAPREGV